MIATREIIKVGNVTTNGEWWKGWWEAKWVGGCDVLHDRLFTGRREHGAAGRELFWNMTWFFGTSHHRRKQSGSALFISIIIVLYSTVPHSTLSLTHPPTLFTYDIQTWIYLTEIVTEFPTEFHRSIAVKYDISGSTNSWFDWSEMTNASLRWIDLASNE